MDTAQSDPQSSLNPVSPPVTPNPSKKWKIVIVVVAVLFMSSLLFVTIYSPAATTNENTENVSVSKSPLKALPKVAGWKSYTAPLGAYTIDYPSNWEVSYCPSGGGPDACVLFYIPSKVKSEEAPLIIMNWYYDDGKTDPGVAFTVHSQTYGVKTDQEGFLAAGYKDDGIKEILEHMAKSAKPLDVVSSCSNPAYVPMKTFPQNFTLSTYHDSDEKDTVESYWPYTPYGNKPGRKIDEENLTATERGFLVNYVSEGQPFEDFSTFSSSVTPILGTENPQGGFEKDRTSIWHINCIDTQEDGPGGAVPFYLKSDYKDTKQEFAIEIYGKATNPTALWSKPKWNIDLLKSTRDVVYIKRENSWQKYKAIGYYASYPTAYGAKPAIHLYPVSKTNVTVTIRPQGQLFLTDELYSQEITGWNVDAYPSGLVNGDRQYLYYEAMVPKMKMNSGYVYAYTELFDQVTNYVRRLGLSDHEAKLFVDFWKQKLPKAPYYQVSHLTKESIEKLYPLEISPIPDTLLRVELYFKPLQQKISLSEPKLPVVTNRHGFTAVEWGGILDMDSGL